MVETILAISEDSQKLFWILLFGGIALIIIDPENKMFKLKNPIK
jgi:hypothetical protein